MASSSTRLILQAELDQQRALLRDRLADLKNHPRGDQILQRTSDRIDDMIHDTTRSAESRLMALLANIALIMWMLERTEAQDGATDEPAD